MSLRIGFKIFVYPLFTICSLQSCGKKERTEKLNAQRKEAETAPFTTKKIGEENRDGSIEAIYEVVIPYSFVRSTPDRSDGVRYIEPKIIPVPEADQGKDVYAVTKDSIVTYNRLISGCSNAIVTVECEHDIVERQIKLLGPSK